jgi:hypothetical protein
MQFEFLIRATVKQLLFATIEGAPDQQDRGSWLVQLTVSPRRGFLTGFEGSFRGVNLTKTFLLQIQLASARILHFTLLMRSDQSRWVARGVQDGAPMCLQG